MRSLQLIKRSFSYRTQINIQHSQIIQIRKNRKRQQTQQIQLSTNQLNASK